MNMSNSDELVMRLVHYFITKENYQPILVNGVENTASNRIFGNVSSDKIIEKFKKNGFIK